jgi:transcriptional regulator with XRE-family HTH domain
MTKAYTPSRKKRRSMSATISSLFTIRFRLENVKSMAGKFADRLKAARQLRDLSQAELAQKADLQPSAVSHFETGRRAPSFDNLKALSEALNVSTDYLLGRVDEPGVKGVAADQLFRHAENMSSDDLETLTGFAAMLAQKAARKKME